MIHSNIHFIYKSAVQCCGRSDVVKNKTQEKTITEGRNLGITKATVMGPSGFNPYKSIQIPLSQTSEDFFCWKQKAIEELLYLMTCHRTAVFRRKSQTDSPSLSSIFQHWTHWKMNLKIDLRSSLSLLKFDSNLQSSCISGWFGETMACLSSEAASCRLQL